MQITEDDEQRTFHFECSSSTGPLGGLQAEIIASKRRSSAAEVIFRKDGPLTEDDISAMSSAMRTANTLIKPVSMWSPHDCIEHFHAGDCACHQ